MLFLGVKLFLLLEPPVTDGQTYALTENYNLNIKHDDDDYIV